MTWPSILPDLNRIEHLLGILKRKVEQHNPSSKTQLKNNVWRMDICPGIYAKLVFSMPMRIESVTKDKGGQKDLKKRNELGNERYTMKWKVYIPFYCGTFF